MLFCLLFDIADLLCELLEDVLVVRILDLQLCDGRQRETMKRLHSRVGSYPAASSATLAAPLFWCLCWGAVVKVREGSR